MSTPAVTPDQSSDDSQAPSVTVQPGPTPSVLSQQLTPTQTPTLAPQGGNRLLQILGAVAKVGETGLASVPDKGRPSFFTGLGEGARGAQAAEANQQAIKFKNFDDSVRAANLHNQDIELHMRQQAQDDAHQTAQDAQHDWDEAHGIDYDVIPNTGSAVTDHLTAQTSANGAASVPAGTHLSADGKSILIPKQTTDTQAGLMQKYNTFGPAFGLPSLPQGAQFVPPKYVDMLQHKLGGYDINGEPINHDNLPGAIASLQTQRDALAKSANTNPAVLSQLDSTIGIYKSNLKALDAHQDDVFAEADGAEGRASSSRCEGGTALQNGFAG